MKKFLKRLRKDYLLAYISLIYIILLLVVSLITPIIINDQPIIAKNSKGEIVWPIFSKSTIAQKYSFAIYPPIKKSPANYDLGQILTPPSKEHLLGTDDRGRDILIRLIYGARVSTLVGFIAVGISLIIGVLLGAIAGYYGGVWDLVLSRLIELMMSFPTIFLILSVISFLGPSLINIMIIIGLTSWTGIARLVRGEFLRLRNLEFVQACKVLGFSNSRIIFRHILPNALTPVFVSVSFGIAGAILTESTLSFLGLGVQPPTPSWGNMLNSGKNYITDAPWLIIWPGFAIFLTVTAYNLLGDALQEIFNPKRKK